MHYRQGGGRGVIYGSIRDLFLDLFFSHQDRSSDGYYCLNKNEFAFLTVKKNKREYLGVNAIFKCKNPLLE